ncbi:hypothetical protein Pst134EA_023041 [Puccinia striiformis f. sp. tritici]|uniref:hypothetical protein n=1 Tax=Puccinia striiformis f. sp. tritici TaxID=168172 RepID=UPI0020088D16|nr:hypothetical protein Pst134EA_023041 [Puccinia striiformis f. sp. tritici]KAH9455582.1 hypothetical protein Pst134EA_023041 [Puccinia striiformis f. sp. tritici]
MSESAFKNHAEEIQRKIQKSQLDLGQIANGQSSSSQFRSTSGSHDPPRIMSYSTVLAPSTTSSEIIDTFKCRHTVSEYDETEDVTIVPAWRSDVLNTLVQRVDRATRPRATRAVRRFSLQWLRRGGERRATEDEERREEIPYGLPLDAYSPNLMDNMTVLKHRRMDISNEEQPFTLQNALDHLNQLNM